MNAERLICLPVRDLISNEKAGWWSSQAFREKTFNWFSLCVTQKSVFWLHLNTVKLGPREIEMCSFLGK